MASASSAANATNGRQRAKHQQRQAAANPAPPPPSSFSSSLSSGERSLLSLLPSPISSLLPSLLSSPLSSLTLTSLQNHAVTSGLIPDAALRRVSRYLLQQRYDECHSLDVEALAAYKMSFVQQLSQMPIAVHTQAANEQHYEVPAAFYEAVLGPRLKYSCAYYPTMRESLAAGEDAMLSLYMERAQLGPNQRILDLGCGWGSFTLYAAPRLPSSHFIAVSNSHSQRDHITRQAKALGLSNVSVVTCDINDLSFATLLPYLNLTASEQKTATAALGSSSPDVSSQLSTLAFDRVVSVEMFEHMKNYARLMALCSSLLRPAGLLFVHWFVHRHHPYHFTPDSGWMAQHFFSGGTMPSADLLPFFTAQLGLEATWAVSGRHYARTSRQWLDRMDREWSRITPIMSAVYDVEREGKRGEVSGLGMMRMWRVFFIAVEELFAWNKGEEWFVQHLTFRKKPVS